MAEEAQELTVTNTGQPLTVDLIAAETLELPYEVDASMPTAVTINIDAVSD
jgi:hypothetical protein